jgi:tetratricopeptide (TPR) repeat protein
VVNVRADLLAMALAAAVLAGCRSRETPGGVAVVMAETPAPSPSPNTRPSLVQRRADSGFRANGPRADEASLARSRQVDELERLLDDGRDGEVRARLATYFAEGGDHPRAHLLAGRLLYGEGEWAQAVPHFQRAVAGSPRWYEPRHWLAQSYLRLERPAAAESVYEEVDRLLPEAPWGPWGMGTVAWQRGDTERGIQLLDEALRRDPNHAPTLRTRAAIAAIGNDAERERDLLERYLVQRPDDGEAAFRLGELAAANGRPDEARRRFTDAWELTGDPVAAKRLAEAAERERDHAAARTWRARAGLPPRTNAADAEGAGPIP